MVHPPVDDMANYLKWMLNGNCWPPTTSLRSQDVYCASPWTLFNIPRPLTNDDACYLFVKRNENTGKTDGCEDGCWRIIGHDKIVKLKGKILGFKKVYKFCVRPVLRLMEMEKRTWVMEEYRLVSQWKQDHVVCKIRRLESNQLESMLCNHIRCYQK